MWIANIKSVKADPTASVAQVEIEYSNGTDTKVVVERISSPETIKTIVRNGVNELNRIDEIYKLIEKPPLGVVDFTNISTPEDLEKIEYENKRQELIRLKEDVNLGLITEEDYDKKLSELK